MYKKLLALPLFVLSLSAIMATTAFAGETGQSDDYSDLKNGGARTEMSRSAATLNMGLTDDNDAEPVEEQISAIEASDLNKGQKAIAIDKLLDEGNKNEVSTRATTWTYLNDFLIWKQSETYYCVPASVKAAMNYLTGSSDNQDTIAKALGTTTSGTAFSNAKTYLNNNQNSNTYISKSSTTTLETMKSNFYSAIITFDAPPLISVKYTTADGWAYKTDGHTMLISGVRSDKEQFRIADPYIQWTDSSANMYYSKTASAIQSAISNRGNGYIY